jgi:hypothetical protein
MSRFPIDDSDFGIFPTVAPRDSVHGLPSAIVLCNVGCLFWGNVHDHVFELKCECGQTIAADHEFTLREGGTKPAEGTTRDAGDAGA